MAESGFNRFFKKLQDRVFAPMEDPKMPLAQHLEELRVRLTRAVVILAIVFACSFYFSVQIMDVVRIPLQNAFVFISSIAFYVGLLFCYFVVLPFALNFLVQYGIDSGFVPQLSIASFVGFMLWFLLVFGLMFELPLAITLLARLGWVDAVMLRRYWKWALVGSFAIAAILTPTPDPFNQSIMAVPMYAFYELGIVGARLFGKKKPAPEVAPAASTATAAAGNR